MPRTPNKKRRIRVSDPPVGGEPVIDFDSDELRDKYANGLPPEPPQTQGEGAYRLAVFCNGYQVGELALDTQLTTNALERSFLLEPGGAIARMQGTVAARRQSAKVLRTATILLQAEACEGLFGRVLGQVFPHASEDGRIKRRPGRPQKLDPYVLRMEFARMQPRLRQISRALRQSRNRAHVWLRFADADPVSAGFLKAAGLKARWMTSRPNALTPARLADQILAAQFNSTPASITRTRRKK